MSLCPVRACPDRTPLWCSNGPRDENDTSGFVAPPQAVLRIRKRAIGRRESRTPKLRTEGQAPVVLKCFTALPKRGEGEKIAWHLLQIKQLGQLFDTRGAVHHALFFLDTDGGAKEQKSADGKPGFAGMNFMKTRGNALERMPESLARGLGGYVPGATPNRLPSDLARFLPKGSDIVMQTHSTRPASQRRNKLSWAFTLQIERGMLEQDLKTRTRESLRKRIGSQMSLMNGVLGRGSPLNGGLLRLFDRNRDGKTHSFDSQVDQRALVFVFVTTDCPIANSYQPLLAKLQQEYKSKGFQFVIVHEGPGQTLEKLRTHAKEFGVDFPMVMDADHAIARKLEPRKRPRRWSLGTAAKSCTKVASTIFIKDLARSERQ